MSPISNTPAKKAAAKKAAPAKPKVVVTPAHQEDIDNLGKIMYEAAEKHGLCDVFYKTVEEANKKMHVPVAVPKKIGQASVSFLLSLPDVPLKFADGAPSGAPLTDAQINALEEKIVKAVEEAMGGKVTECDVAKWAYGVYAK